MEWTIPTFAFQAEAGPHLPIPEGWKAELAKSRRGYSADIMGLHSTTVTAHFDVRFVHRPYKYSYLLTYLLTYVIGLQSYRMRFWAPLAGLGTT